MRTASVADPNFALATRRGTFERVGRASAAGLAVVAVVSLLPATVVPNVVPMALILACLVPTFLASLGQRFRFDAVTPLNFALVAIGVLYVCASALELLPTGNQRPVRPDFILRHAYYVFLWLPLMTCTAVFFGAIWPDLGRAARRWALPLLAFLAIADLACARLLGDPDKMAWEDYVAYLDPSVLTFIYAGCFFLHVATTGRALLAILIVTAHGVVSSVTDYGMMYNTMTGVFVLFGMCVFALAIRASPRHAVLGLVAIGAALALGLVVGVSAPSWLGFDGNTQWRFLVWRENLFAALNSGLLGVGFGTPYYDLSPGNVHEAYRLMGFAEFAQHALAAPMDILYIRGQHSSFVNAFYRTGVLGGLGLIAFNVAVVVVAARAAWRGTGADARLAAAAVALFIVEASQIALHVGIESPRYFAVYALAAGLARAAGARARGAADA